MFALQADTILGLLWTLFVVSLQNLDTALEVNRQIKVIWVIITTPVYVTGQRRESCAILGPAARNVTAAVAGVTADTVTQLGIYLE